jgi:cell division protein FtsQ
MRRVAANRQKHLRSRRQRKLAQACVVALVIGAPLLWFFLSGTASRLADEAGRRTVALSARAGLKVEDILVEGRERTPPEQLVEALGVRRGDPILAIDLDAVRHRLEAISWVRSATVERRLPAEIHLVITERAPIALWQSQGRYFLVDRDGQVVGDEIAEYGDLPLTVGENAPDHVGELIALLSGEPELAKRFRAAQWVGDRRWNITLDRDGEAIEIRLPEDDPASAWHELARIESEQQLLERKVNVVDMRVPDRLVLRTTDGGVRDSTVATKKTASGKDT